MVDDDDATVEDATEADPGFRPLLEKLSETYSFDFREYKAASLMRRIRARMGQVRIETFAEYARYLDLHAEEHVNLFNTILINVTGFFRDPEAWTSLAEEIIPRIVGDAHDSRALRIWSAGCSSGEEPYSLAILLAEQLGDRVGDYQIKIYSTDIDEDALMAARHALYRTEQLKDVPDRILTRYFARDGQLWRLRRDIRRWCIFGSHNLTQAPPLSHIDLLVCRNVLIYFSSALQERILARFHYAVRTGGFLFLGRSESLLARSRLFTPANLKWRIFQHMPATPHASSVLPESSNKSVPAARTETSHVGVRVQRALEALASAVMIVDAADTILTWNPVAEALFETPTAHAVGRKFRDIDVSYRVEGLRARMEEVKVRQASARLDGITFTRRNGDVVHANVTIAPLFDGPRFIGVLVTVDDASDYARLKDQMSRIAEQHATAIEELQSTNEELETTNEELQSTNEELETTNEELQSTNEELETTVEELQAANAELAALNSELEERGAELARLDFYHRGFVNSLDEALIGLDRVGVVRTWNHAAERMWGLRSEHAIGRDVFTLPLGDFVRRLRPAFDAMLEKGERQLIDGIPFSLPGRSDLHATLHITPVKDGGGVVVGGVAMAVPD